MRRSEVELCKRLGPMKGVAFFFTGSEIPNYENKLPANHLWAKFGWVLEIISGTDQIFSGRGKF